MKIYTGTGDEGQTGLANGSRVSKDHRRVELYGTSDELNSCIGLALSLLQTEVSRHSQSDAYVSVEEQIHTLQSLLFELGAELAGFPTEEGSILASDIQDIEQWIDGMNEHLPEMKQFILPGGQPSSAQFHVCRTVCRRLERLLVAANRNNQESGEANILGHTGMVWINRLSDYLFVLARYCQKLSGREDIPWKSRMQRPSRKRS
ncbi:MAG: cob(I)yrinic acid a,c-diamide adenosyltransferase [Leptospiraceae bacterium]|nr:cob(I)yrinic acid a,c-diamide adenosyltransferase [Leptospiraceae bacterium]MCB1171600.1 cob(I)yrinic acid a,c-diamide adenosyltransferase [Leptospiraceae bacterium]